MRLTYKLPGPERWSRWDEIKQRIGNCRGMLTLAWLALSSDSAMFSVVIVNSSRRLGDGLIAAAMANGTLVDPDGLTKEAAK